MLENFRKMRIRLSNANESVYEKLIAKEGDLNGRNLEVEIINGGIVGNLKNVRLRLHWKNLAVGNSGIHDFDVVDASRGLFEITYPESMLNRGNVMAHISIMEGTERITGTRNFTILVEGNGLSAHTVIASDDFQALNDALIQINRYQAQIDSIKVDIIANADRLIETERIRIQDILKSIKPRVDGLEQQFNDAMANITADSEVITGRTSTTTGDSYATVGKRLDEMETMTVLGNHKAYFEIKDGRPRLRLEEI